MDAQRIRNISVDKDRMKNTSKIVVLLTTGLFVASSFADTDVTTKFTNKGTIGNTRHNLTQRPTDNVLSLNGSFMDQYRNNYQEVCVYCHTPHGANDTSLISSAPLWNRTVNDSAYTTYASNNSTTITATIGQPGANSLTCLSCHDGTIAVDSIINMPGSGRYDSNQKLLSTIPNFNFLNSWNNQGTDAGAHMTIRDDGNNCMVCHSPGAGPVGFGATDFTVFEIGTDLTNDHPVGITYPASRVGSDFNGTDIEVPGRYRYYDGGVANQLNDSDIRFYFRSDINGGDYTVECASCHDPHGVDSAGPGSDHLPTFLRKTNTASALCQTCHNK